MTKQEQIEEMSNIITEVAFVQAHEENGDEHLTDIVATALYNAGYRKAEELVNLGYRKLPEDSVVLSMEEWKQIKNSLYYSKEELEKKLQRERKETAKEILERVVNICENEEEFQDGTVNTQLEPLYFGIANGCNFIKGEVKKLAREYGVEVEE